MALFAFSGRDSAAAPLDAELTLGFEDAANWSIENGTIVGTTTTRTQGNAALEVQTNGYTVLKSRLLGPLGQVSETLSFDLLLPQTQPNPAWFGATQLYVSVPSLGLYRQYLGQQELTGLSLGQFHQQHFSVPAGLLGLLRGDYSDLTFEIALNVPAGNGGSYLIDNLEVTPLLPPNSTIGAADRRPILGFEVDEWEFVGGDSLGSSALNATQGNFALALQPNGYSTLTSPPLPGIGPVDSTFSIDVFVPELQPNPFWFGAVQLFVDLPSHNLYNFYLGQVELTGLPAGDYSTLEFEVPPELQDTLNGNDYTDLRFIVVLNVASGAGVHFVDNLQIGALTTDPEPLPFDTPIRRDLVGFASSGSMHLEVEGDSASPEFRFGVFYVEERDHGCLPTATSACRYIVHYLRFNTGPFELHDEPGGALSIQNRNPFEIVLGGAGEESLSSPIPSNVIFEVSSTFDGDDVVGTPRVGGASTITVNPAGGGFIAFSASFTGRIDGQNFNMSVSTVADSPLANHPPDVNAGADQTVSSSECNAFVAVDGTATVDPDGNLDNLRWFEGDRFLGIGTSTSLRFYESGTHLVTAVAQDRFGSEARDETLITVNLPGSCAP